MLLAADSTQTSSGSPFLTGNPFNLFFPNAPSESNLQDALPKVDPNNPSDVPTELQAFGNAYPGLLADNGVLAGGAPFFDITGEAIGYSDGTVLGTFDTTLTATPEPGSMCLLAVAALGLLGRKMRRNGKQPHEREATEQEQGIESKDDQ